MFFQRAEALVGVETSAQITSRGEFAQSREYIRRQTMGVTINQIHSCSVVSDLCAIILKAKRSIPQEEKLTLARLLCQRSHERISSSSTPQIMPPAALLVLCATSTARPSAIARRGTASASKLAPERNSVTEIMLEIKA